MKAMRLLAGVCLGAWMLLAAAAGAATFPDLPQADAAPVPASRFVLTPAIAGSSVASGVVEFGGPASAVTFFSVRAEQLAPGLYWVVMVRKADGATFTLAPLSVFDTSEIEPDRRAGDDPNQRTSGQQVQVLQTQALIKIPSPIDLAEVAQLLVVDVNGVPVLTGAPERP